MEAEKLINGDRQKAYRHPALNYKNITDTFNALTGHTLTPKDGIVFMIVTKLCREYYGAKRDNRVDLCGYTGCLDMLEESEKLTYNKD